MLSHYAIVLLKVNVKGRSFSYPENRLMWNISFSEGSEKENTLSFFLLPALEASLPDAFNAPTDSTDKLVACKVGRLFPLKWQNQRQEELVGNAHSGKIY